MAAILAVHGIAQEKKSASALAAEWVAALRTGLCAAGYSAIANRLVSEPAQATEVGLHMCYYGDLFVDPGRQGRGPAGYSSEPELLAEQLAQLWLERAASQNSVSDQQSTAKRELLNLRHSGEGAQGPGSILAQFIRSVAKIEWFAPYGMGFAATFVNEALAQVTRYLTDDSLRANIQRRVKPLVGSDTIVVVAHSLGSVIAYEVLRQIETQVPLFVTIGSPLALDTIIYPRLVPKPPDYPMSVKRWRNVADPEDFIAAKPDLSKFFNSGKPSAALFEPLYTVNNGAEPHRADFYLRQAIVAQAVAEAVSESRMPHN